jgi:PAS domain S-box-containing protein
MGAELRKAGIDFLGQVPWGTHFCQFYETKQDLLDILIPYFKAGLEGNEFCLWLVSEPLTEEEARNTFRSAVAGADGHLAASRVEIFSHSEWFLENGTFDLQRVIELWKKKLAQALAKGYAGMRATGNPAWVEKELWNDFSEFERKFDELIANQKMIVLCTYPLSSSGAAQILDVARTHKFAMAKRHGHWEIVETPEVKQAKQEIQTLNEDLEQRVIERTSELTAVNRELNREITERKRAEEAVRESQQLLQQVLATLPVGVVVTDRAGDIVLANSASKRIWGDMIVSGPERWARSKGFWHESGEEVAPAKWASVRALSEGQTSLNELIDIETFDGQQKTIQNSAAPIRNAEGVIVGAVFVNEDVTDRVRAEEELRESEAKFRALSENAPAAILIYQGTQIRYANPAAEIITGYSRRELLEMNFWDTVHSDFRDIVRERGLARQRGKAVPLRYELRIVTKAGEERWLDFSDGTFELEGKPAVVAMIFDITERKRAEQALTKTTEQLRMLSAHLQRSREEERSQIARELHDEIGQVLTGIKLSLQRITSARAYGDKAAVEQAIGLTNELIGRVRDLSLELRPAMLDDLGLLAALRWHFDRYTTQVKIQVDFKHMGLSERRFAPEIETAAYRIVQEALTNVARHAGVDSVEVDTRADETALRIKIRDHGTGFDPDSLSASATAGLSGMRERATILGGHLTIESAPGAGMLLVAELPLSKNRETTRGE